jgi:hypothetical protein
VEVVMAHNPSERDILQCVDAYVAERGVATSAARRLGFSDRKVRTALRTQLGQRRLIERTTALLEQYRVDSERVVGEAAAIAFADLPQILFRARTRDQLAALPPHQRAAVSEVHFDSDGNIEKIKLHPKLSALQLLASYLGMAGAGADSATAEQKSELGGLTIIGPDWDREPSTTVKIPRPRRIE